MRSDAERRGLVALFAVRIVRGLVALVAWLFILTAAWPGESSATEPTSPHVAGARGLLGASETLDVAEEPPELGRRILLTRRQQHTYLASRTVFRLGVGTSVVGAVGGVAMVRLLTIGMADGGLGWGEVAGVVGAATTPGLLIAVIGGSVARGALVRAGHRLPWYPPSFIALGALSLVAAMLYSPGWVPEFVVGASALVVGVGSLGVTNERTYRRSVPRRSFAPWFDPRSGTVALTVAGRF